MKRDLLLTLSAILLLSAAFGLSACGIHKTSEEPPAPVETVEAEQQVVVEPAEPEIEAPEIEALETEAEAASAPEPVVEPETEPVTVRAAFGARAMRPPPVTVFAVTGTPSVRVPLPA